MYDEDAVKRVQGWETEHLSYFVCTVYNEWKVLWVVLA